jgi:hypothetical protein
MWKREVHDGVLARQIQQTCVGTSHSATGAIESALKYVSPDAHWIARRLATAGGKRIKMRPLSAIDTDYAFTQTETSACRQKRCLLRDVLGFVCS